MNWLSRTTVFLLLTGFISLIGCDDDDNGDKKPRDIVEQDTGTDITDDVEDDVADDATEDTVEDVTDDVDTGSVPDVTPDVASPDTTDTNGEDLSAGNFETRALSVIAEATCRQVFECPESLSEGGALLFFGRFDSASACEAGFVRQIQALAGDLSIVEGISAGRLQYNRQQAGACLSSLETTFQNTDSCDLEGVLDDPLQTECSQVLTGTRQRDQNCLQDEECVNELTCNIPQDGSTCYGQCGDAPSNGNGGNGDGDFTIVGEGEACDLSENFCEPSFVCAGAASGSEGSCELPGEQGDDCTSWLECAPGLYCQGADLQQGTPGSCQPQKSNGESCTDPGFGIEFNPECQSLLCRSGQCSDPANVQVCEVPDNG